MAEGLSPEQLETRSDIRRLYGPVRRELAGIFDPFSCDVAEGIEARIEQGMWNVPMMEAPYGDAYYLPPELFGDQDIPRMPEDDVGITALIQRYAESGIDSYAATYHSPKAQAELHERLRQLRDDNPDNQLDPARWQLYRASARYEREELEVDRLASQSAVRARVKNTEPTPPEVTGNFDTYLYFPAATQLGFRKALPDLMLPVGAYGKSLTENLITATATMMAYGIEAGREVVDQYVNEGQQELLTQHTTRMNRKRPSITFKDTNIATVIEGIISIGQTIALLCAEKAPGYDDADQLVHDLIADGTVLDYTFTRNRLFSIQNGHCSCVSAIR